MKRSYEKNVKENRVPTKCALVGDVPRNRTNLIRLSIGMKLKDYSKEASSDGFLSCLILQGFLLLLVVILIELKSNQN
ncbi:CLUMA_CG000301, isoform A [Clunio marinus]|uniref:CLUMA_CG000301, isoform A n=1 Tax=Clunio marinus TaxID=568069 RepID=A0A1J1HEQ3_9DIPT|nr:CLUMA_CG000301, isoform A [Clunio marinus]